MRRITVDSYVPDRSLKGLSGELLLFAYNMRDYTRWQGKEKSSMMEKVGRSRSRASMNASGIP